MQEKISFKPWDNLAYDVPASLVVFLVALPLCLGIALASGAPLFSGLIAGAVGGIVAGSLSKSAVSVSGPAAGLSTIVFASIHELGSFSLFLTCVILAGMVQVLLGIWKAGRIGHFFPVAVIRGMLAAIGLILILKQLPHAIGYDADFEGDENFTQSDGQNTFTELLTAFDYLTPGAVVISVVSLVILVFWDHLKARGQKWITYLPGPLVVVVTGIALNMLFQEYSSALVVQKSHLVNLSGFDHFHQLRDVLVFPDFSGLFSTNIYKIAFTIALVASLESLLSVEASDKLDPFRRSTPLNNELIAQGAANMTSGLLGGLPVTAVIVRSSANITAGARTKLSAILHGLFLVIIVLAIPNLLQMIPLACLAGILLTVGYKLTSISIYKEMFSKGKDQYLPFIVTVVAILLSDILVGIGIGLLVAIFFVLKTNYRTAIILVNSDNQYLIRFTKDVSFVHKSSLRMALEKVPPHASLVIDESKNRVLDADILETLDDFVKSAPRRNIKVEVKKAINGSSHLVKT